MPFQSSGIIVVDKKTSVVSQQEHQVPTQIQSQQIVHQQFLQPQHQQHKKSSVLTRQILNNQSSSSGSSGNIIRNKHQKVIYGISSSCSTSGTTTTTSIVGDSINNITKSNNNVLQNCTEDLQHSQQIAIATNSTIPNKNLMRRHQRLLSNSTATTIIQQNQQLQQYSSPSSNIEIQQQQIMNSQSQQQNLTPTTQFVGGNQIIQVSEEYLEHATAQGAQIVNITPSDLINSQFIKLINSDGNQQNVIIDSLGNITTGNQNTNQNSSKLLVGNLTTVLKSNNTSSTAGSGAGQSTTTTVAQLQQSPTQQQQINFLNAKQIPYLATASSSPTVSGSTKSPNSVQKIVNIPLKTNNIVKSGNNLLQQQQNIQKIQMPRNVQVVTRVQQQQQQQQPGQQIVMQPKYLNNSTSKLNNNLVKKQTINQMKVQQHKITNLSSGGNQQVKTFIHQQPQQPQQQQQQYSTIQQPTTPVKQMKSQKLIKQFNHNINNSTVLLQQQLSNTAGCYQLNNSKFPQKLNSSNKLNNTAIKYVMQNHIVTPSTNQQQTKNSAIQQQTIPNSIVVNQQIINPLQQQSNQSGTIKFVNAHGAVLQTSTTNSPTHRIKNNNIVQQQHHFIDQNGKIINFLNENDYQTTAKTTFLSNTSSTGQQQQQQQQSSINDDIVIVNGTQMTDEVSARILQSMAQKSYSNQRQQQQQYVQQQQKNLHQPSSPIAQQQQNVGLPREYPIYAPQNVQQYQTSYQQSPRQVLSQPNSRTQSLDRKHNYESKKSQHTLSSSTLSVNSNLNQTSSDYYRVNSKNIRKNYTSPSSNTTSITNKSFSNDNNLNHNTTTTTFIDNISLPLSRAENASATQQSDHDDDIIGEEVRPIPVSTNDLKLLALHAFLQDHTYVAPMPARLPLELCSQKSPKPTSVSASACSITATTMTSQQAISHVHAASGNNSTMVISDSKLLSPQNHQYVIAANNLNHGIQLQSPQSNFSSAFGQHGFSSGGYSFVQHGGTTSSQPLQIQSNQTPTKHQLQQSPKNQIECNNQQQHLDDDANSIISNDSRNDGHQGRLEMDLGEETETAPEAEAEDDSVTRCICDFTHDDGYMICCDKCFAWQHVDCMGIDRQNIPEEYLCEICQERPVDKIKARALQNQKRREIQAQLLLNSQMNQSSPPTATASTSTAVQSQATPESQIAVQDGEVAANVAAPSPADYKALGLTKKGKPKKSELLKIQKAMAKKERQANKRKENKRQTKRKYKNSDKVSKDEDNLRQWIENYEVAVTNHYSPELRARLHSIYKQPQLLQVINAHENKWLKNCQNMESKGTTIPHGGGKILISNFDIPPNSAIIELCGRYMLTTQFKTQNPSLNMNSSPTQIQTPLKSHRTPGPFIFFYQMPSDAGSGPEVCVDTRTYGNDARFVRRSCRPNAELQYSFEKGAIHLFIVSLTNIMASTEITIRHEPHDLIALENKTYSALQIVPTSTKCACGLMKDCIFGVSTTSAPSQSDPPSDNNNFVPKEKKVKKKVPNGAESAATSTATLTKKQLKKRGRSTSSSGESNAGLLSPNPNLFPPSAVVLPAQNLFGTTVISNIHDSGIYTSSSSPSIPSPTHQHPQPQVMHSPTPPIMQQQLLIQQPAQVIALPSPLTLPQAQLYTTTSGIAQQGSPQLILQQISSNQQVQIVTTLPSTQATSQLHSPILPTQQLPALSVSPGQISPQMQPPIVAIQPQVIPVQLQSPQKSTAASTVPESIITPVQKIHVSKPAQQPKVIQKIATPTKDESPPSFTQTAPAMAPPSSQVQLPVETALQVSLPTPAPTQTAGIVQSQNESSASTSNTSQKSVAAQNVLKSPQKVQVKKAPKSRTTSSSEETQVNEVNTDSTKRDIRKLTREERKMEAIVKAFEKMEKNQQRKKELKQQRGPQKRRKSNSPSSKRSKQRFPGDDNENLKKNPIRKKKRKGPTKTYVMQTSTQRKRRRSRINSNESDAASEDSTCMLSPPLPRSSNNYDQNISTIHRSLECTEKLLIDDLIESQPKSDTENQAAGLLLAFANHPKKCESSPPKAIEQQISKTSEPKISSACLLIESALGLCNSNANLAATKTKKSLMSDWLNQSNEEEQSVSTPSPMENLVQAAMVDYKASQSAAFTTPCEPNNLSIAAKKVEEFIIQTDCSSPQQSEFNKFEILNAQASISNNFAETQAIQNSANFQTCSNSAAKKRWLRQAISEETTDVESHSQSQKACGGGNSMTSLQTSASNSPISNGFTTPLKKRRLVVLKDSINDESGIVDEEMGNGSPDDSQNVETEEQPSIKTDYISDEFVHESKEVLSINMEVNNENDDDVDILRSPSPGSKNIVAENLNLVKIQPEDADDKELKIDVEKDSDFAGDVVKKIEVFVDTGLVKQKEEVFDDVINDSTIELVVPKVETSEEEPQISETKLEEQNNDIKLDAIVKTETNVIQKIKPITTKETKIILKKEQSQEEQNVNNIKLSPELIKSPVEKNNSNNAEDEIANIQMKLQSFHTENIMILQSRNKKSKSRTAKTDNLDSDCKSPKLKNKDEKVKYSCISKKDEKTRKSKNFPKYEDSDEDVKQKRFKFSNDKLEKQKKRRESSASTSSSRSGEDHRYPSEDSRNDLTSKFRDEYVNKYSTNKKDNFHHYNTVPMQSQQSIPLAAYGATPIISSYLNAGSVQSYDKFINNASYVAQSAKLLPAAIPQQSATFVPSQLLHTNFNSQPIHTISTNSCISLPQQSQFYPMYNKPPQPLNALQATQQSSLPLQTVSKNLLLSEYLDDSKPKSFSTLGAYMSTAAASSTLFGLSRSVSENGPSTLSKSNPITPILTKTTSHDPRLNPQLTLPEPAPTPKRKLSINEYRKRKQQSTESVSSLNSQESTPDINSNKLIVENGGDFSSKLEKTIEKEIKTPESSSNNSDDSVMLNNNLEQHKSLENENVVDKKSAVDTDQNEQTKNRLKNENQLQINIDKSLDDDIDAKIDIANNIPTASNNKLTDLANSDSAKKEKNESNESKT